MPDQTLKELDRTVRRLVRGEGGFTLDQLSEAVAEILIDETTLAVCFDVHRAAKTGEMEAEGMDGDEQDEFRLLDPPAPGLDVLGQPELMKRPPDAKCPVCARSIACTRFAPHLEKCVGLGRNSSRLASKRIANNQRETNYGLSEDEEEEEWTGERKKKKRDKLSPRRNKNRKNGGGDKDSDTKSNPSNPSSSPSTPEQAIQFEQLTEEERKVLFSQVCGVISESTRHMCTHSVRCQKHSDTQRRTVRTALFGDGCDLATHSGEWLEEGALKDSLSKLWEKASRASSPADSTSTVASAGSTRKVKGKRGKPKRVKVHVSQPSSV
ncbi:ataxin-7-like protein 3 [Amphibalanus amphitrite]|uniref:ataxin-7-like protein 3 n=1 Tax=Amphibalanus amphitrite TaxID=1232801 RepID=UPI001C91AE9C|nr:ataxin-7-like protein 3 [Amphibalanus amphitrite]XP_043227533.1 ataxin-7-like protein 3 [Amphibalanus amphitrite]XP_043227534.1 ataxin-7-like protein 3 [Amphibalanus amphitrite]